MSYCLCLLVLFCDCCQGKFLLGRVLSSGFDLDDGLSGMYTPPQARELCDRHPHCAGFTYRGLLNTTKAPSRREEKISRLLGFKEKTSLSRFMGKILTTMPVRQYFRYFIGFVRFLDDKYWEWNNTAWVTYIAEKDFLSYQGTFPHNEPVLGFGHRLHPGKKRSLERAEQACRKEPHCGAFFYDLDKGVFLGWTTSLLLDMSKYNESSSGGAMTFINPWNEAVTLPDSPVDACCDIQEFNQSKTLETVKEIDTLARIPCNATDKFIHNHLRPMVPAVLTGCTEGSAAQQWSLAEILQHPSNNDKIFQFAFIRNKTSSESKKYKYASSSASEIKDKFLKRDENSMFRVVLFDYWNQFRTTETDKFFQEGISWPQAIPSDLRDMSYQDKIHTNLQRVTFDQAKTGAPLHVDVPYGLDSWITSLHGYKHWIILPRDTSFEKYKICTCLKNESNGDKFLFDGNEEDLLNWFANMVPWLRGKTWFGRKMIEILQAPGETVYIPSGMPRAVLNLEDNIIVSTSFLSTAALDMIYPLDNGGDPAFDNVLVGNIIKKKLEAEDRRFLMGMRDQEKVGNDYKVQNG